MFLTLNRSALQLNKRYLVWRMFFTLNHSTLQLNKR